MRMRHHFLVAGLIALAVAPAGAQAQDGRSIAVARLWPGTTIRIQTADTVIVGTFVSNDTRAVALRRGASVMAIPQSSISELWELDTMTRRRRQVAGSVLFGLPLATLGAGILTIYCQSNCTTKAISGALAGGLTGAALGISIGRALTAVEWKRRWP